MHKWKKWIPIRKVKRVFGKKYQIINFPDRSGLIALMHINFC